MKTVLLGMNNPISEDPRHALFPYPPGCTGWRLLELLRLKDSSIGRSDYLRGFDRVNLVQSRSWSNALAREAAATLPSRYEGRTILVLGEAVRRALRLPKVLIHPVQMNGVTWRQLPHPSGRCRWYNDPECRDLAASLLYELYVRGRE